jgi:hypothetical protein
VLPTRGPTPAERALLQVATRGVVRLFNAVSPTLATSHIHHASLGQLVPKSNLGALQAVFLLALLTSACCAVFSSFFARHALGLEAALLAPLGDDRLGLTPLPA